MFKIDDEVVCVDAKSICGMDMCGLCAGKIYTVAYLGEACVALDELRTTRRVLSCTWCNQTTGHWHYAKWRFVKLPKQTVEHSETAEA